MFFAKMKEMVGSIWYHVYFVSIIRTTQEQQVLENAFCSNPQGHFLLIARIPLARTHSHSLAHVHDTCYNVYILFVCFYTNRRVRTQHSEKWLHAFVHICSPGKMAPLCMLLFVNIYVHNNTCSRNSGNVLHAKISTYRGKTLFFYSVMYNNRSRYTLYRNVKSTLVCFVFVCVWVT